MHSSLFQSAYIRVRAEPYLRVCSALISYAVKCIARDRKRRVCRPAKALHGPDHRRKGPPESYVAFGTFAGFDPMWK
jgi:hypothetical protein